MSKREETGMDILDEIRSAPPETKRVMRPMKGAIVLVDQDDDSKVSIQVGGVMIDVAAPVGAFTDL